MEPFDLVAVSQRRCPKCQSNGRDPNDRRDARLGYEWSVRWHDAAQGVYGDSGRDWYTPEYLAVKCPTCGYSFEMEPADQRTPVEA